MGRFVKVVNVLGQEKSQPLGRSHEKKRLRKKGGGEGVF